MGFEFDPDRSDALDTGYATAVISVTWSATEAKVGASRLPYRQALLVQNDGATNIQVGPADVAVSGTKKGITIVPGQTMYIQIGTQPAYLIAASTGTNAIVQELA